MALPRSEYHSETVWNRQASAITKSVDKLSTVAQLIGFNPHEYYAYATFRSGGRIFGLSPHELSDSASIAAVVKQWPVVSRMLGQINQGPLNREAVSQAVIKNIKGEEAKKLAYSILLSAISHAGGSFARQNPPAPNISERTLIIRQAHAEAKAAHAKNPRIPYAELFGEASRRLWRDRAEGWLTEHCGATPADLAQLRAVSDGSYGHIQGKFRVAQRGRPDRLETRIDAAAGRLSADPEVQAVIRCGFPQPPRGQGRARPAPVPEIVLPERVRILARKRDWNARGNGTEEHRRIMEPGDTQFRWASEGEDVRGEWEPRGMLAGARHCKQTVSVTLGTIVVAFDRDFSGGQSRSSATVSAGIVALNEEGKTSIEWGLTTKGKGEALKIKMPSGEWVPVAN